MKSVEPKPLYRPELTTQPDGWCEQRFMGSFVFVGKIDSSKLIGATESERGGTHNFLISYPQRGKFGPADVTVQFNDQHNGCTGESVRIRLDGNRLLLEFLDDAGVTTGRISYHEDADHLQDARDSEPLPLRTLRVELSLSNEKARSLLRELQLLRKHGLAVDVAEAA